MIFLTLERTTRFLFTSSDVIAYIWWSICLFWSIVTVTRAELETMLQDLGHKSTDISRKTPVAVLQVEQEHHFFENRRPTHGGHDRTQAGMVVR